MKWLTNSHCANYFIPECNLFRHKRNDVKVQEALFVLKYLNDEVILGRWFMQNYIIKAMSDVDVLPEQNKPFNLEKNLYKQSFTSKDYRDFMHLLKQFLYLHHFIYQAYDVSLQDPSILSLLHLSRGLLCNTFYVKHKIMSSAGSSKSYYKKECEQWLGSKPSKIDIKCPDYILFKIKINWSISSFSQPFNI